MPLRLHMILLKKYNWIQNSIWSSTSDMNFPDKMWLGDIENGTTLENLQNLILTQSRYSEGISTK